MPATTFSSAQAAMLRKMLTDPDRAWRARDFVNTCGVHQTTASIFLAKLVRAGWASSRYSRDANLVGAPSRLCRLTRDGARLAEQEIKGWTFTDIPAD